MKRFWMGALLCSFSVMGVAEEAPLTSEALCDLSSSLHPGFWDSGASSQGEEDLRRNRMWGDFDPFFGWQPPPVETKDPISEQPVDFSRHVLVLSLPKSGNHLIYGVLQLISETLGLSQPTREEQELAISFPGERKILFSYIGSPFHKDLLKTNIVKILMVRDPRDVLISQMHWINAAHEASFSGTSASRWKSLSMNEQLTELILWSDPQGITAQVKELTLYAKDPQFFICRFEDLIGEKGGGSRARQEEAIAAIALRIGCSLSHSQIKQIADRAFDVSGSIRKEQVGVFKAYFNLENRRVFEDKLVDLSRTLGYF